MRALGRGERRHRRDAHPQADGLMVGRASQSGRRMGREQ